MIHKINTAVCRNHLMQIVELQGQLLEAICDSQVNSNHVTETWVIDQLPHFDRQWVTALCQSYNSKQKPRVTLLASMQAIANLPEDVKTDLLNAFNHDLQVLEELEQGTRPGRTMRSIKVIQNAQNRKIIRTFFELFYAPNFDKGKGYPRAIVGGQTARFDRSHFATEYKEGNEVKVCPLCDGQLGLGQVDHFYPKSKYPFLSCHPLNLVPSCKDCNMAPCKGEKPPLDHKSPTNQMEGWFHPVFEPLGDWRGDNQRPTPEQFRVEFTPVDDLTTPVLTSDDERTRRRLKNLNKLINLQSRWQDELMNQYQGVIAIIQEYHKEGHPLTETELVERLEDLAWTAGARIGIKPNAILEYFYTKRAAQRDEALFLELWIENSGADPLTGL